MATLLHGLSQAISSCKTVVKIINIKIDVTLLCKMVNVQDCLWQKRKSNASFISKRFAYQFYSPLFKGNPDFQRPGKQNVSNIIVNINCQNMHVVNLDYSSYSNQGPVVHRMTRAIQWINTATKSYWVIQCTALTTLWTTGARWKIRQFDATQI